MPSMKLVCGTASYERMNFPVCGAIAALCQLELDDARHWVVAASATSTTAKHAKTPMTNRSVRFIAARSFLPSTDGRGVCEGSLLSDTRHA